MEQIDRQLKLEEQSIEEGVNRYRAQLQKSGLGNAPPGLILINQSIDKMAAAVKEYREATKGKALDVKPMLDGLSDIEVAWITAKKAIEVIPQQIPVTRLANEIADIIIHQSEYKKFKELMPDYLNVIEGNLHTSHVRHRKNVIFRAKRLIGIADILWTVEKKTKLGSKLLDLFISSTGIVQLVRGYHSQMFICANPDVKKWIEVANQNYEIKKPLYLPMIAQPMPWFCPYGGGYYSNLQLPLVKTNHKNLQELEQVDMSLIYKAVNGLQNTKWRINKRILEVIQELWDRGGDIAGLPPREMGELPVKPWFDDAEFEYLKQNDPDKIKAWKRSAAEVYENNAHQISKRAAMFLKLKIAQQFKDEPVIYYCWQMDWRGRYYPVQNFINPQMDDSGKALLEFAEGHPLGERGAYWLKIHLANTYGQDKCSFEGRIKWVHDNERLILDSARNPVDGCRFWMEADDPFSFLAACFEYDGYHSEGNKFISHLPISVDATASGLQHFSAMLRDEEGGKAVNLIPGSKPSDLYQTVADAVNKLIEADNDPMAKLWRGKIDRQLVKRGVMTTPLILGGV